MAGADNASFIHVSWMASCACSRLLLRVCEIYEHHKGFSPIDHICRMQVSLLDFLFQIIRQDKEEEAALGVIFPQK